MRAGDDPGTPPYLTVVTASRNDDYAPAMAKRLERSLAHLLAQLERHALAAEILVVDWNPPPDRPGLETLLQLPHRHPLASVEVLRAPPELHRRHRLWEQRPLHLPAAFNLGIRRARGRFVVPRVADVFWSEALAARIAQRDFAEDRIYRCDRYDVDAGILEQPIADLDAFSKACRERTVHHHAPLFVDPSLGIADLHTNASGDFLLMARAGWDRVRGFVASRDAFFLDVDSLTLHAAHHLGWPQALLADDCCVFKLVHGARTVDKVRPVWTPAGRALESLRKVLGLRSAGQRDRFRGWLDYPRRSVRGFAGTLTSYERNFVREVRRLAEGGSPRFLNPESWGDPQLAIERVVLTRCA